MLDRRVFNTNERMRPAVEWSQRYYYNIKAPRTSEIFQDTQLFSTLTDRQFNYHHEGDKTDFKSRYNYRFILPLYNHDYVRLVGKMLDIFKVIRVYLCGLLPWSMHLK